MKRFRYLVLLSAILLETTSDALETLGTTSVSETLPEFGESEASAFRADLETNGTEEGKHYCAILCGNPSHLATDELETNIVAEALPECTRPGKFPLCDLCPGKYFECSYDDDSNSTFQLERSACPPETVFNASEEDCLPERQNVSKIVSWQMEDVINSAEDVCNIIKKIDSYDDTTITTLPLQRGLEYQEKINAYVTSYNRDLEVAQSHMRGWRKGKSIVNDIRKTYYEAKGYEKQFNRMYNTNKGRMTTVEEDSIKLMESLEEGIKDLKAEIERLESKPAEEIDTIRMTMKATISQKKEDLVKKEEKLHASTPMALKLAEMSVFIGYVRTHASEVVALATNSSDRIDQLYENIAIINNTFSVYTANASNDLDSLISEEQSLNTTFQTTHREIDSLEEQKVQLKVEQDNLMKAGEEIYERMKSLNTEIKDKTSFLVGLQCRFIQTGNCDDIVSLEEELKQCRENQTYITKEIEQLSPRFTAIYDQTKQLSDKMPLNRINEIQYEKLAFEMFTQDLKNMEHGITSVQKDLKELVKMTRTVKTVFQHVNTDLGKMIAQSKAPKTESERDMAMEKIIEDLDLHQRRIDQSSETIINMRQCTLLSSSAV